MHIVFVIAVAVYLALNAISLVLFNLALIQAKSRIAQLESLIEEHSDKLEELEPEENYGIFGMQEKGKW